MLECARAESYRSGLSSQQVCDLREHQASPLLRGAGSTARALQPRAASPPAEEQQRHHCQEPIATVVGVNNTSAIR